MQTPSTSTTQTASTSESTGSNRMSSYGSIQSHHFYDGDSTASEEYWTPLKTSRPTEKFLSKSDLTSVTTDNMSVLDDASRERTMTLLDRFFCTLGFETNPFASDNDFRNNKASDMRLSMLSNFSTAYNVVSISMALNIMQELYETTPQDKSLCSSALIAGMIIGQLAGGAIGDILGRHVAMALVMSLQIVGALVTACAFDGRLSIYAFVAFWRLILGIGCGGVYPLAATITAETNSGNDDGGKAVALTFSMQGIGYLFPPILTATLTQILPLHICWRFVLGSGALPGLWLMVLRLQNQFQQTKQSSLQISSHTFKVNANAREVPVSVLQAICFEKNLFRKLMGTGGCWFLFDVLFYGNVLFQPVVLSAAFGPAETVRKTAVDTTIVCLLALPGYFVSVFALGRQSPRFIQAQGFFVMAILYGIIGVFFHQLSKQKVLMIVLYGSTFFFSNYGPNATVSPTKIISAYSELTIDVQLMQLTSLLRFVLAARHTYCRP